MNSDDDTVQSCFILNTYLWFESFSTSILDVRATRREKSVRPESRRCCCQHLQEKTAHARRPYGSSWSWIVAGLSPNGAEEVMKEVLDKSEVEV